MRLTRLELKDIGPFVDAVFEIPEPKGRGELVLFRGAERVREDDDRSDHRQRSGTD